MSMRKAKKFLAVLLSVIIALEGMIIPQISVQATTAHTISDCGGHEHRQVVLDKYTGSIINKIEDNIFGYTITNTGLYNTVTHLQFIQGYFYNASDKYHIMDINETEVIVQDLDGNYLFDMADANYSNIEELILPPRTKVKFNVNVYSPEFIKYDLTKIEACVACEFSYQECVGENCAICGGPVTKEIDTNDKSIAGVSEGMKLCISCNGSGKCKRCGGSGLYEGFNGRLRECGSCRKRPGVCSTCKGEGEVPIPKPSTRSYSYDDDFDIFDDDFDDFTSDDSWKNQYKCSKCNGSGKCSNCGGTGKKYGKMCFSCMGDKKCYKCGGDGYASY